MVNIIKEEISVEESLKNQIIVPFSFHWKSG